MLRPAGLLILMTFAATLLIAGCVAETGPVNYTSTLPDTQRPALPPTPRIEPRVPVQPAQRPAVAGPASWQPGVPARRWNYIVIHHSATTSGCAADFDAAHKRNGWDELGYHFVIGNGTDTRDGHVEVGPRWQKQKWGAHAKTSDNRFNQRGIGICLVGDFDHAHPTPRQLRALTQLTAYLMDRHGIPPQHVIGHRDTKPTACPGRHLDVARIRQSAAVAVAQARRANNTLAAANR